MSHSHVVYKRLVYVKVKSIFHIYQGSVFYFVILTNRPNILHRDSKTVLPKTENRKPFNQGFQSRENLFDLGARKKSRRKF